MISLIKLPDRDRRVVWELTLLFQDPLLLALSKPPGPDLRPQPGRTEVSALLPLLHSSIAAGKPWAKELNLDYLMPAHRPEAQTSGVIVFVRSHDALRVLASQFRAGSVRLAHLALVRGGAPDSRFELSARLSAHPEHPGQMRVDSKQGNRYRTQCEVVERFRGYSLLRCLPSPGRPGQIGAHLRHARFPLVGDPYRGGAGIFLSQLKRDYEPKRGQVERPLIGRSALHLETVELQHPATREPLILTAPLAKDLAVTLKYLRRFAG